MHGNVMEWCEDWYDKDFYANSPKADPKGPETGVSRVVRGGSWNSYGWTCRASSRFSDDPTSRIRAIGFRVFAPGPSMK